MAKPHGRETFVVQILNRQNATWQGVITWTEGRQTQSFRSALEMIKLIDSALADECGEDGHTDWQNNRQTNSKKPDV
jgi:hypothetical protein